MNSQPKDDRKRPYVKPDLETEKIFEVHGAPCGKCAVGPSSGFACSRLMRSS